jgi:hypothetical protein
MHASRLCFFPINYRCVGRHHHKPYI